MGKIFNVDEVFEMAIAIETNAAKFYSEAADKSSGKMKEMLSQLSAMEKDHERIFEQMRGELGGEQTRPTAFDPDNEAALYLQVMASGRGWEGKAGPKMKLSGDESPEQILQTGIEAEKNSVLFYVGLRELVSARAGKDKVDKIITEEVKHVAVLRKQLRELGGQS